MADWLIQVPTRNKGLSFDMVDDYVRLKNGSLIAAQAEGTIEIILHALNSQTTIYSESRNGETCFYLYKGMNGDLGLWTKDSSGNSITQLTTPIVLTAGKTHIAYAWGNGSREILAEGIVKASDTNQGYTGMIPTVTELGRHSSGNYFGGAIYEVRIWNYKRTPEQILNNKDIKLSGNETGLVAYYLFDGSDSVLSDATPNNNDGAIYGATWQLDYSDIDYPTLESIDYTHINDTWDYFVEPKPTLANKLDNSINNGYPYIFKPPMDFNVWTEFIKPYPASAWGIDTYGIINDGYSYFLWDYPYVTIAKHTFSVNLPPVKVKEIILEWPENPFTRVKASIDGFNFAECISGVPIAVINRYENITGKTLHIEVLLTSDGKTQTILEPIKIKVIEIEQKITNTEWVDMGEYYSIDWNSPGDSVSATVKARDKMELLSRPEFRSPIYINMSLYEIAESIILDGGVKEYAIDSALKSIIVPYAYFDVDSHREALKIVAEASLSAVYCDREGAIRFEAFNPSESTSVYVFDEEINVFPGRDTPLEWSQIANYVTVEVEEIMPDPEKTDQETLYQDAADRPQKLAAGATDTFIVTFSPGIVKGYDGIPDGITTVSAKFFAKEAEFVLTNNTAAEIEFWIGVYGRPLITTQAQKVKAQDDASIRQNGRKPYPYKNILVQTRERGQQIADGILAIFTDPRRDINLSVRGNPSVRLGDRVTMPDGVNGQRDYYVTKQNFKWDGALEAEISGRKVNA